MNRVKDKSSGERLMGFGHRVYKNYDPRAAIIKKHADAILRKREGGDQCSTSLSNSKRPH